MVFRSVKIHTNCLFRSVFSIDMYKNIIFNVLLLFKLLLLVIELHESSQLISQFLSDMLGNWGKVYIWGLLALPFKKISIPTFQYFYSFFQLICKNLKSDHHLLFLAYFPDLEMFQFWYTLKILGNIYISVFLVDGESIVILAFVKYTL